MRNGRGNGFQRFFDATVFFAANFFKNHESEPQAIFKAPAKLIAAPV